MAATPLASTPPAAARAARAAVLSAAASSWFAMSTNWKRRHWQPGNGRNGSEMHLPRHNFGPQLGPTGTWQAVVFKSEWIMLVLAFLLRGCAADDLFALLTSAPFLHAGTTTSASAYALIGRPCSYLEPENVTVAPAQGIGWTEGGSCPLLYACGGANCSGACEIAPAHPDFDRAGGDYRAFQLPQTPLGAACAAQCCAEVSCAAWAYTDAAPAGQAPSCAAGAPCCYLKAAVHPETPAPGVVCGVVERAPAPGLTAPPMGLRSAAPLGGVGAGALELRGDGSVHEVTIVNQSPAGAAEATGSPATSREKANSCGAGAARDPNSPSPTASRARGYSAE